METRMRHIAYDKIVFKPLRHIFVHNRNILLFYLFQFNADFIVHLKPN